jgi:hypothetical protein
MIVEKQAAATIRTDVANMINGGIERPSIVRRVMQAGFDEREANWIIDLVKEAKA